MSFKSPRSPSFPSRHGFQSLPRAGEETDEMSYSPDQQGIPLTNVQTRSSSTGARKQGEGLMGTDFTNQSTFRDEEKKGFFKSGGKRKVKKINSKPVRVGTDGEEINVNWLGRFYHWVVNFSIVTRYLVYVAPVAILLAIPIVLYAVFDHTKIFFNTGVRTYLFWTWIEIIWLSVWISKLVARFLPYIFMFLCGVVSSGTRKYAMILKAVELQLSLVGWAVATLVTFTALTDPKINGGGTAKNWVKIVSQVLGPALIASILFLAEKVIIQMISINYHKRSFDGRIKDSKRSVHLLGLLYEASRTLFPMYCPEFREEDLLISDNLEVMLQHTMHKGHKKSGSTTPMQIIGKVGGGIGRVGDKVTSVFGNIASEITGKQVFNPTSAHSVVVEALEKTRSSEALAKRLWMSFVVEGRESLYSEDIEEVLGPARKEEAEEIFSALDNDANGDISLDEMIMKVIEIGRDRKAIAASMRDVGQAIGVLDQVLLVVLFVIIVFIFVAFQDTSFVTTLATAGTTLLSLSFVFAATTQEFLGSCIMLFVKHPYDVGDRVDIVGPAGAEFLVVEQISLLFTVFKRIDTMKTVQVPNIVLNNLWIENITRSKAMKEQLDMYISFDTSLEDIETLRSEMEAFVRHPENSRDFQPEIILEATGIGNMDKLQLKIEIRHKSNWANETVRAARRSKFMCALVLALRKVPIYAPGGGGEALGGPTNPGYSVAVNDDWAAEARDKAAKAKEAKRLIPTKAAEDTGASSGADLGSAAENKAAEALNQRRPTEDPSASWGARDDITLGSEDESPDRARDAEIEGMKKSLLKRESTRGKRKAGERIAAPAVPYSTLSLTPAEERNEMDFDRYGSLDEEAGVGMQQYGSHGTGSSNNPYQSQQQGGYSIYPAQSQTSAAPPSVTVTQPTSSTQQQQGRPRKLSLGFKNSGS